MLTTCTACGTQFRVSTAQLRAVHGLVRCSRCHSVFDAFEKLREEFEAAPSGPEATPPGELAALDDAAFTIVNEEPPSISAVIETPIESAADNAAALDIQLKQEKQAPPDDLFAELWGESAAPGLANNTPAKVSNDKPLLIEDHIAKPPALVRDKVLYKHVKLPPREHQVPKAQGQITSISGWGVGVVLLALLLGIQAVNAYRLELEHSPVLGPPLVAVYSALGHPLSQPQAPDKWLVSSINVTSGPDTPGILSITGTLENAAGFTQAWPLLRVELTDRYGDALRARDFPAGAYLSADQASAWLGPGMATRFRIDVVDPGPEAVGFQVRPCFELAVGHRCSSTSTSVSD